MTDDSPPRGRVDLRALGAQADAHRADRVIGGAMARISTLPATARAAGVLEDLGTYLRPAAIAAGVLIAIATGAVFATDDATAAPPPAAVLATWAESGYVPTNGELLVAFQGYGR